MSLKEQLLARFKEKPDTWFPSGSIEKWVAAETKYSPSNAKRRLREMAEDGILSVDYYTSNGVQHAKYCYNPETTTAKRRQQHVEIVDGVARITYSEVAA